MDSFLEAIRKMVEIGGSGRPVSIGELLPGVHTSTIALLAALLAIVGILQCFLGYKSFKFWCSFIGLIVGAVAGIMVFMALRLDESAYAGIISILFMVCFSVAGAFLAYRAYLVGVFLYAFVTLFMMCYAPLSAALPIIAAVIVGVCAGVAAGIVAVILQRISIIVATCLLGGLAVAIGLMTLLEGYDATMRIVVPVASALACAGGGFFVQLATTKKRHKGKPIAQATTLPAQDAAKAADGPAPAPAPNGAPAEAPPDKEAPSEASEAPASETPAVDAGNKK